MYQNILGFQFYFINSGCSTSAGRYRADAGQLQSRCRAGKEQVHGRGSAGAGQLLGRCRADAEQVQGRCRAGEEQVQCWWCHVSHFF